jgi:hypothetical protein
MLSKLFSRLSYANVVSTIALFLALGGVSYAAVRLPANSVGTRQLKRGAVTGVKIKNRAVTSSKIAANAVSGFNVDESTLAAVPEATHATSADSATSAGSSPLARVHYEVKTVNVPSTFMPLTSTVACPGGLYLAGGGATVSDPNNAYINDSAPINRTTWQASVYPYSGAPASTMTIWAICAPAASVTP